MIEVTFSTQLESAAERLGDNGHILLKGQLKDNIIEFVAYRRVDDEGEHELSLWMLEEWLNYIVK